MTGKDLRECIITLFKLYIRLEEEKQSTLYDFISSRDTTRDQISKLIAGLMFIDSNYSALDTGAIDIHCLSSNDLYFYRCFKKALSELDQEDSDSSNDEDSSNSALS